MGIFIDTLANVVSGLGTAKDKKTFDQFIFLPHSRAELDAAHRGDWLARKIVEIPAYDMTRQWRDWKAEKNQIEVIENEEKRLGIQRKVNDALVYAALYGGGALFLGFGDSDTSRPAPKTVGRQGLKYVHAVNRYEIGVGSIIRDVTSPWFGEPEFYQMADGTGTMLDIHPSRVVPFIGARRADKDINTEFWGDSRLEAVYDAIHHAALANSGIASLISEAKLDVIKIPRLSENLSSDDYSSRLTKRFSLANQMKSLVNALVIDSEEEWSQKQISFANMPEVMREFLNVVCGAADIPATRLLGMSPGGLNSTGESDTRNYYDRLSGDQNVTLTPTIARLDDALISSALGNRPADIWFEWSPLWQESQKEKAETAKAKAEATAIYQKSGLIPVDALAKGVQNQLSEDGIYPGLDDAIAESDMDLELEPVEEGGTDDPNMDEPEQTSSENA